METLELAIMAANMLPLAKGCQQEDRPLSRLPQPQVSWNRVQVDRTFTTNKLQTMALKILPSLRFTPSVVLLTDLNHWKQQKRNTSRKTRETGPPPSIQQKNGGFFGICHLRKTQRLKPVLNTHNSTCLTESKAGNKPLP